MYTSKIRTVWCIHFKNDITMPFSDSEAVAWENNRDIPVLVIIVLGTHFSEFYTQKSSNTSQHQFLAIGYRIRYYSSMLSNFPWK